MPRGLPAPNTPEHTDAVVDAALPLLAASGGRAFLLFTTLRALAHARERLAAAFARDGLAFPLLVQGEGSRSELLVRFRELGNAVLLGSSSFWEGVDVPGNALSLVIIDKLPFAPPDDPLLAARLDRLRAEGGNPFMAWQLPQAAIALKQGAGRLIRTETDRGVLAICDPRLTDKPYGRQDLAEPAADAAHARDGGCGGLPGGDSAGGRRTGLTADPLPRSGRTGVVRVGVPRHGVPRDGPAIVAIGIPCRFAARDDPKLPWVSPRISTRGCRRAGRSPLRRIPGRATRSSTTAG